MRRIWMLAVVGLLAAACGGGDDSAGSDAVAAPDDASESPATTTTAAAPQADAPSGDGGNSLAAGTENVAFVTIGDLEYAIEISVNEVGQQCTPDFVGNFWVVGDADNDVLITLPPPDASNSEPPVVNIDDNVIGHDWVADEAIYEQFSEIAPGQSQVDSYTFSGNTASGTATFLDMTAVFAWLGGTADEPEGVQGTFEVTCADG